ncbi:AAA family ATPase [Tritonibacter mobilis]|uniref:AAA family ATPase n=1 Tax=Tritonibacter mobilis TaxID=379347 RepID=UPI00144884F0|nr:ParA family protein [Rhodobacteraceae bacterium R_SAG6]
MYVISFANPKGGSGKSTTALLVAEQLALSGQKVVLIDNDPTQNLVHWSNVRRERGAEEVFRVEPKSSPDDFDNLIEDLEQAYDFAIVDMEGVKDLMASVVTMSSHLVVIPLQASPMDARNAASQLSIVKMAQKHSGRVIPHRFLFTRTNPTIATKLYKAIRHEMGDLPTLDVNLVERAAYKHMHEDGHLLAELDPALVSNLPKAQENAVALVNSLISVLKEGAD